MSVQVSYVSCNRFTTKPCRLKHIYKQGRHVYSCASRVRGREAMPSLPQTALVDTQHVTNGPDVAQYNSAPELVHLFPYITNILLIYPFLRSRRPTF